jgi:hypothetical protein
VFEKNAVMNPEKVQAVKERMLAAQVVHFTRDGVEYRTIPNTLDECLAESEADEIVNGDFYRATADQI